MTWFKSEKRKTVEDIYLKCERDNTYNLPIVIVKLFTTRERDCPV